jgi:hypothetical protein
MARKAKKDATVAQNKSTAPAEAERSRTEKDEKDIN